MGNTLENREDPIRTESLKHGRRSFKNIRKNNNTPDITLKNYTENGRILRKSRKTNQFNSN